MKSVKILNMLCGLVLASHCFLMHADDLVVLVNTIAAFSHEERMHAACDSTDLTDECVSNMRSCRSRERASINKLVVKTVEAPALDHNGNLTEESAKIVLVQAYNEGKLKNSAFNDADSLTVTDIKSQEQGNHTEQLFLVKSTCGNPGENVFIFKGIGEADEIEALVKGSRYEHFEPLIYPHVQDGYPQIVFPIAYLSYKDQNGRVRSLSLMNVAPGNRILSLMEKFASKSNAQEREGMHRTISEAYFQLGAQMARFYRRYAADGSRLLPMGIRHGDLHIGNIFYDSDTKRITLIDNNRIVNSMGHPESVWRDFVPLLVKRKPQLKMDVAVHEEWFALSAPSFMVGFLSAYPACDRMKILEELESHMKRYESNENRKMRYEVGVVHQAMHALGKSIREYMHDGNIFKRLKTSIAERPLVAADVDVNAKDEKSKTALFDAAGGDLLVMWPLIAAGADVNARDKELNTPLHHAALANNPQAIKILVQAGADINARARNGRTPLDVAKHEKHKEAVKILTGQHIPRSP